MGRKVSLICTFSKKGEQSMHLNCEFPFCECACHSERMVEALELVQAAKELIRGKAFMVGGLTEPPLGEALDFVIAHLRYYLQTDDIDPSDAIFAEQDLIDALKVFNNKIDSVKRALMDMDMGYISSLLREDVWSGED